MITQTRQRSLGIEYGTRVGSQRVAGDVPSWLLHKLEWSFRIPLRRMSHRDAPSQRGVKGKTRVDLDALVAIIYHNMTSPSSSSAAIRHGTGESDAAALLLQFLVL